MKIALAGIVKNEFPYLLEWIAHHINIGIDHFIIANHGSTDGTTGLLEALQKLGIVTTFFISAETEAPQLPAYEKIIEDHKLSFDWIGFLDADEFLVLERTTTLRQILTEQDEDTGTVVFNLKNYGSSFQNYPDHFELPAPVTARFSWRAKKDFIVNFYIKSFINTKALKKDSIFVKNPHSTTLKQGYKYVNVLGEDLEFDINNPPHKTKNVIWEKAHINHYTIKSKWEFVMNKLPKGLADNPRGVYRKWIFFQANDINDVFEPMPFQLQQLRDEQINNLKYNLQELGYSYKKTANNAEPLIQFDYDIEMCTKEQGTIYIKGWIYEKYQRSNLLDLNILIEDKLKNRFYPTKIICIPRPDIVKKLNIGMEALRINTYLGFEIVFEGMFYDEPYKLFSDTKYLCDLKFQNNEQKRNKLSLFQRLLGNSLTKK